MDQIFSGKSCFLFGSGPAPWGDVHPPAGAVLIAVDGGLAGLAERGLVPDHLIGDFDSLPAAMREMAEAFQRDHPGAFVRLPVEKDDTDTHFAVRYALERGCRDLQIYGGLGGRLDHTLANIQTLLFAKRQGAEALLVSSTQEIFILEEEERTWTAGQDALFSAFAMEGTCRGVTLQGMQYAMTEGTLTDIWPVGCSNHIRAGARILVRTGRGPMLCILSKGHTV